MNQVSAPDLTSDWQVLGATQNLLSFRDVLLLAYNQSPAQPTAVTRLRLPATATIGTGIKSVTPAQIGDVPLSCDPIVSAFAARTALSVDTNGYTVWGEPAGNLACGAATGAVYRNLGLNVLTGLAHDSPGWDDNNNGCGCGNLLSPPTLASRRGYLGVR